MSDFWAALEDLRSISKWIRDRDMSEVAVDQALREEVERFWRGQVFPDELALVMRRIAACLRKKEGTI